jgi:hypothetical protein
MLTPLYFVAFSPSSHQREDPLVVLRLAPVHIWQPLKARPQRAILLPQATKEMQCDPILGVNPIPQPAVGSSSGCTSLEENQVLLLEIVLTSRLPV